jgi:hypothetical protein
MAGTVTPEVTNEEGYTLILGGYQGGIRGVVVETEP